MSLYLKYRPTKFEEVVGQESVITALRTKLSEHSLPHTLMLSGPTGTGKSTLAGILSDALGCTPNNLCEVNCADVRGIDSVREIQESIGLAPMGGKCRVWILDEVVQLPKATQQAFLQLLEKVPRHVYFILCTSDTSGLLRTFMDRCFHLILSPLKPTAIESVISKVLKGEDKALSLECLTEIGKRSDGSARKALQILEGVLSLEDDQERMDFIGVLSAKEEQKTKFLALALLQREPWRKIAEIIKTIEHKDLEGLRHQVLDYAGKVLLSKDDPMAKLVIRCFQDSWASCGRAGLIAASHDCCLKKTSS